MVRYVINRFPRCDDAELYQTKKKGIYGSLLVLRTFAWHFNSTTGAVVVPAIGNFGKPYAALALAAAGVRVLLISRCLLIMVTGRTSIDALA
jgi:hypothetical protein